MKANTEYLSIRDEKIPTIIKSYKTSKVVRMFFKDNQLIITKPKKLNNKELVKILKQSEEYIYNKYIERIRKNK